MRRRKIAKRPLDDEEISSHSSVEADEPVGPAFERGETPEQTRLRLARALVAETRAALGDDAFFLEGAAAEARTAEALRAQRRARESPSDAMLDALASRLADAPPTERALRGHRKAITAIAFGRNGDVFTAAKDCAVLVFVKAEGYRRQVLSAGFPADANGHRDEIYCLEASPDGELLASAGKDCVVKLWRAAAPHFLADLSGHKAAVHALSFRGDGAELLSLAADRSLKLWAVEERALVQTMYGHRADPQSLVALGTDSAVSVGYDRTPIVWRLDRETQAVFAPQLASLDCVAALDAHSFATGDENGELCVWTTARRRPVVRLPEAHPSGWVTALASRPASGLLASAARAGPLNIYRLHPQRGAAPRLTLLARVATAGVVTALRFSPCGGLLAVVEGQEDRLGRWNFVRSARPRVRLLQLC